MHINIVEWSYEGDGDLIIVTVKDDRGHYYKGSLELMEMCICGKPVEGDFGYCTECLDEADDEENEGE